MFNLTHYTGTFTDD